MHRGDGEIVTGEHVTLPREAISCPLCEEPFACEEPRTPCVLPCFHTYCRQCLQGWAEQGGAPAAAAGGGGDAGPFSCPNCRAPCATPVSELQVNFALMTVVEAERVSTGQTLLECQECDEGAEPTHFCPDCSLLLCGDCTAHHRRSKNSKHHALQTVAEFKERKQALPKQKRMCKKHKDQSVCAPEHAHFVCVQVLGALSSPLTLTRGGVLDLAAGPLLLDLPHSHLLPRHGQGPPRPRVRPADRCGRQAPDRAVQ